MPPEEYALEENEERSMIEPKSLDDAKLQDLISILIEWINDELAHQRIIVKDIVEDLYDGQVLQKLLGTCISNADIILCICICIYNTQSIQSKLSPLFVRNCARN